MAAGRAHRDLFLGVASVLLLACGGRGAHEARAAGSGGWRHDPVWDDGQAEFAAYEITWARYGNRYAGRALLVTVKEPWAPDLDVKADTPRPDGFEVLKLNHVRDVPTGIYTYHQMASVYVRRDSGTLQKIAATSSEACGVSTADMTRGLLRTRSYFDGQGDRTQPYPAQAVPEDGLPMSLRDWVRDADPPATLLVFPSLLMGRFTSLEPVRYDITRRAMSEVEVPAGRFRGVEIRLEAGGKFLAYTFEVEAPHRLLRFERDDGTEYRLAKVERLPYWTLHDPGDEAWLPPGVR